MAGKASLDDILYLVLAAGGGMKGAEFFGDRATAEADANITDAGQVVDCAQSAGATALPNVVSLDTPDCDVEVVVEQLETGQHDNFRLTLIPSGKIPYFTMGAEVEGGQDALVLMAAANLNDAKIDRTDDVLSAQFFGFLGGAILGIAALAAFKRAGRK